jgi:hypothetical protein
MKEIDWEKEEERSMRFWQALLSLAKEEKKLYDRIYQAVTASLERGYEGFLDELPAKPRRVAKEAVRLAKENPAISYEEAIDLALDGE